MPVDGGQEVGGHGRFPLLLLDPDRVGGMEEGRSVLVEEEVRAKLDPALHHPALGAEVVVGAVERGKARVRRSEPLPHRVLR